MLGLASFFNDAILEKTVMAVSVREKIIQSHLSRPTTSAGSEENQCEDVKPPPYAQEMR